MRSPSRPYDTAAWRRLRRRILDANPVCNVCNANPATECHDPQRHLPADRAWQKGDPIAVCRPCHVAIHRRWPNPY